MYLLFIQKIALLNDMYSKLSKFIISHAFFLGFLLLFFIGSFYRIDYFNFWRDEAFTVNVAQKPLAQIAEIASQDVHPPLHMFILHFWMLIFGSSEISVRFLSILFASGALVYTYLLSKLLFQSSKSRWWLLVFTATTPLLIYHAIEGRAYSMLVMFTISTVYYGLKTLIQPKKADYFLFIFSAVVGLYTHAIFLITLAGIFIWQLFLFLSLQQWNLKKIWKARGEVVKFVGVYLAIGILFLPWLYQLYQQIRRVSDQGFWLQFHPIRDLLGSFELFYRSDRIAMNMHPYTPLIGFFLSGFGGVCTLIGAFSKKKKKEYFFALLLVLWLGLAFVISFKTPLYFIRYLVFVVPVIQILIVYGLEALEAFWPKTLVFTVAALLLLSNLYMYYGNAMQDENLKSNYKAAIQWIGERPANELVLHSHGYTLHSFLYYAPEQPGYLYDPQRKLPHFEGTAAFQDENYFAGDLSQYEKIWVPYHGEDQGFNRMLENTGFEKVDNESFAGGLYVDVWQKK